MEFRRPALGHLRAPSLPDFRSRWRAEAEFCERSTEIQACATDDDRPTAGREEVVDLRRCELGVLADAEDGVDREAGDEPVLEVGSLRGVGGAGQDLEPRIDL